MLVPLFLETMHKKIWDEVRKKGMEKQLRALMKMNRALLAVRLDARNKIFGQVRAAFGGNLKSIVCGGAPLSPELIKDFYAFGITVLEGYGITECAPLVSVNSPGKIKFRSVGTPVKGCQVKIDKNPEDETGEILVKGDNVMMGYYKNEEATAEVFTEDGWFRTGDIGYMDDDGYIFITGRKKNVIILSNGKNVFPEELEEYLATIPCILESVVLARKNDAGEQTITAIVVPNEELMEGKSKDEVYTEIKDAIQKINAKLPSFKQIRKIEVKNEKFERTTSKKIQRFKVV
jgi:long-chain acyl-CoA synthetase